MWILKGPEGEVYYLVPGQHTIGRRNCSLVLENDQSISRTHAHIEVVHPPSNTVNPNNRPNVYLCDTGSKYGTTVIISNEIKKLEKDIKHDLEEGVIIHFGLLHNKWQLHFDSLVVVVSSLAKSEKQKLRTVIGELGGHVVPDWHTQTTHLVMEKVTLTVKAISALANAIPIVTPRFWDLCKAAVESKLELPKCEDFIPPIGEAVLNEYSVSFAVNPKRKSLFKGKTFYFFSEFQFKDHGGMVKAAGGEAKYVETISSKEMQSFVEKDAVAMQLLMIATQSFSLSQAPDMFPDVVDFLKTHGKRLIPASEIGLAVLHCSIEKYCNPDFNFASMLLRGSQKTQPLLPGPILATETQDSAGTSHLDIGECNVILDSGTESKLEPTKNEKRGVVVGIKSTQDQVSQQTTQQNILSQASMLNHPKQRARTFKRLRVLDDSDSEIEILSPRKIPAGPSNVRQKECEQITIEESSSDCELSSMVSIGACGSKLSRTNASKSDHPNDDSDDPDQLFADFKESQTKSKNSSTFHREKSPDIDAEDLFADFQDDNNPSARKNKNVSKSPNSPQPLSSLKKALITDSQVSESSKRKISDDDCQPPDKKFAKLDLSACNRKSDIEYQIKEEEEEFMSTTPKKNEYVTSDVKPSCNISIFFKPLLVSKTNITTFAPYKTSTASSGVVNFKKFKKVHTASSILPHIIGGRDLEPYQSFTGNNSSFQCNSNGSTSESEDEDDPTSVWGSLTKSHQKRSCLRKL